MILFRSGGGGRPTHKELSARLREAIEFVRSDKWSAANPGKFKANLDKLEQDFGIDVTLKEDQTDVLLGVLAELSPEHYAGGHPPEKSYEKATPNQELLEFRWTSHCFSSVVMYFKFAIFGKAEHRRLFVYSLHRNREEGDE